MKKIDSVTCARRPRTTFKICYTFVCKKSPGKIADKYSKPLEKFKHRYAPKMFKNNPSLCSFSLRLIFFSEKPFYGNYSTLAVSFSYKCCNFSHVCLLVKMAWQTVTRSIRHCRKYSSDGTKLRIYVS